MLSMRLLVLRGFVITLTSTSLTIAQSTIYVDRNATVPPHNGSTWCSAYWYLQDALTAAQPGDTICIADGEYRPDEGQEMQKGDREASFQLQSGVTIEGGYVGCGAANPDARNMPGVTTILTGDLAGDDLPHFGNNIDNSYHVLTATAVIEKAILDGLTITAGNGSYLGAGGIHNEGGSLSLRRCLILENRNGGHGGAVANYSGDVEFEDCVFYGNESELNSGGAIYNAMDSSAFVRNCSFVSNIANTGGAIHSENAQLEVMEALFRANKSTATWAGGISNDEGVAFVGNSIFVGNSGRYGGAIVNRFAEMNVINCLFDRNIASEYYGGGMYNVGGAVNVINCTFAYNRAQATGGGIRNIASANSIYNSVFWRNQDMNGIGELSQVFGGGSAAFSSFPILNVFSGSGNIQADPLFIDTGGADNIIGTLDDDLRLSPGSPCIDASSTLVMPPDTYDLDSDGDFEEPIPLDLNWLPRFVDDPATEDTGEGGAPKNDMGAFEYQQLAPIKGDTDRDGDIDVSDYSSQFGCFRGKGVPVTPTCMIFDFDFDSDVDLCDWSCFQAEFTGVLP